MHRGILYVRFLQSGPWGWPSDARDEEGLLAGQGLSEPVNARPGQALMGAYLNAGDSGLLCRTDLSQNPPNTTLARSDDFQALDRRARVLALSVLPITPAPSRLREINKRVAHVVHVKGPRDQIITGDSFGLSLVLTHISHFLNQPITPGLFTSAAISASGDLAPVAGVAQKLAMVKKWAISVNWLIFHPQNEPEVEAFCHAHSWNPKRDYLTSASEVIQRVWPNPETALSPVLSNEECSELVDEIVGYARRNQEKHCAWSAALRTTDWLIKEHPTVATKLTLARAIFLRHLGRSPGATVSKPTNRNDDYFVELSHYLQHYTDTDWGRLGEILSSPDNEFISCSDPMVQGAVGRGLAVIGQLDRSAQASQRAIKTWRNRYQSNEASRPLCEALRVAGLQNNPQRVGELEQNAHDLHLDWRESVFLAIALGRAYGLCGQLDKARPFLQTSYSHPHFERSRHRWNARLFDDRREDALKALAANKDDNVGPIFYLLAQLDSAIREERDPAPTLNTLAQLNANQRLTDLPTLLAQAKDTDSPAQYVVNRFPY